MASIFFLCSKGVIEISKDAGFNNYKVFLERRYIGIVINSDIGWWFSAQLPEQRVFTSTEADIIIQIALGKTVPSSLIEPKPITIDGEPWSIMMVLAGKYELTNAKGIRCGKIWQSVVDGRRMWVSDTISEERLRQISVQLLAVSKNG
jgi:hypothetical protein